MNSPTRKLILHIDMDSYFATCEQQANPFLRGKPIAVSGHPQMRTVIAAASREAKKYGVKTGMSLPEAKNLCPDLIFVLGDPEKYVNLTKRSHSVFLSYTDQVEVFSIDEVFMDVTDIAIRHGGAKAIALEIKKRFRQELGEWMSCSVGIAPNKLMAKVASELEKPDGLVEITEQNLPDILSKLELTDFCGIGKRIEARLALLGIKTVADLQKAPIDLLIREFGVYGEKLRQMSFGQDSSPVKTFYETEDNKSYGHQFTLAQNTLDREEIERVLLKLSEKTARRARSDNLSGRTVRLFLRFSDFSHLSRQITLNYATDNGYDIFKAVNSILKNTRLPKPVRLIGVSISNMQKPVQLPLLPDLKKELGLTKSLDTINDRYGEFTIQRCRLLNIKKMLKNIAGYGLMRKF